jgi:iron complex transport system permease protein
MAALGAVASFWLAALIPPAFAAWSLPVMALAGAGLGMASLALIAGRTSGDAAGGAGGGIALFTLAGLMLASLAGALTALAITLAPNPFALSEIVLWLNGALTDRSWREVAIAAPLTAAGIAVLALAARSLDALTLGEEAARSMGLDPARLLVLLVAGVGLTVGAGVAVAGIIGFVGLIVPHLVRPLTDRLPSSLLLPSALAGACLVLAADSVVRILPLVTELRLGIALSLIGAPFFGWLLIGMRRGRL